MEKRSHFTDTTLHSAFTGSTSCDHCGLDPATIVDGEAIGLVEEAPRNEGRARSPNPSIYGIAEADEGRVGEQDSRVGGGDRAASRLVGWAATSAGPCTERESVGRPADGRLLRPTTSTSAGVGTRTRPSHSLIARPNRSPSPPVSRPDSPVVRRSSSLDGSGKYSSSTLARPHVDLRDRLLRSPGRAS